MNQQLRVNNDQAEIIALIERETDTFVARDLVGWSDCWVQDERTREVCISPIFGATVLKGWDEIKHYMQSVFEAGKTCELSNFQRTYQSITLSGDLAHVVFNGRSVHASERIENTFETRVVEKQDGAWRILYASFVIQGHQPIDENRLAVDAKGNILCAPEKALAAITSHSGLQISRGRLRARTPKWDKVLQAALRCAAKQHRYFEQYNFVISNGQDFRLPIVVGETDDGGVLVCVLFVRDGMTFVEVQGDPEIDARLKVAQAIFGLSEGQMALANRIVSGDGLTAAAAALNISVNTARTHLSRIYIKTGVKSQTALVRILLSVG